MPLASVWASAATWSTRRIGAEGTPALASRARRSSAGSARVRAESASMSAPRCSTRFGLPAKRGSRARAGASSASQALAKSTSDPAAIITQASRAGKAS